MDWMLLECLIDSLQYVSVSNYYNYVYSVLLFAPFFILNTAIGCLVLPIFANGIITYATDVTPDFDLGTTATYSCNDGYTLDLSTGDEVRTCIDDGNNDAVGMFSGQAPACVCKYQISFI